MSHAVGLDLSLTSTGIASIVGGFGPTTSTLKPPAKLTGLDRMHWIQDAIDRRCFGASLVIVEGPSYGSQSGQQGHHERAGLWWLIQQQLWKAGIPTAIVPPSNLKKFATGAGNAGKDAVMIATARRFPDFEGDNNAADALWLAAMGADHLGVPLVAMPAVNRAALDGVRWPTTSEETAMLLQDDRERPRPSDSKPPTGPGPKPGAVKA